MPNVDEAAIFDALYTTIICPIFYAEVLADLSKQVGDNKAEKIVSDLAKKTPIMHATPNTFHVTIAASELEGHTIPMRGVPARSGGKVVQNANGEISVIYDEAPEAAAFDRWQNERFEDIERDFASRWRAQLAASDHATAAKLFKQVLRIRDEPKNLEQALSIANEVVDGDGQIFSTLKIAYMLLGLPENGFRSVHERWKKADKPRLRDFAPYTAYCLLIDIFFHIAVDKRLISPDRSSNRVDMSYLYYLPFAQVFVSNDKLHRRTVPLFMRKEQIFIGGEELKNDLALLDAYFSGLPEEQLEQGLFRVASRPPNDDTFLTTRIWNEVAKSQGAPRTISSSNAQSAAKVPAAIWAKLKAAQAATGRPLTPRDFESADHVMIKRMLPMKRGKWSLLPPGVKPEPR